MPPRIFCLGAVNLDLLYRVPDLSPFLSTWPHLKPGGEIPLPPPEEEVLLRLLARHAEPVGRMGGGQAANTAFALARLGLPVALLGRVGADADGAFLKESLTGVNLDYLVTEGRSGRAYVLLDPSGERTILVAPHTNDDLRLQDLPWEALSQASFLHLTSFVGEGPLAVQEEAARRLVAPAERQTRGPGQQTPVITLDAGELYARRGRRPLDVLLDQVDTLLVTEREWQLLGGHPYRYSEWAPPIVLIKRGPKGLRLIDPRHYQDFPAAPAPTLVDTLGAGDVLAAGYLAGRFLNLHLKPAIVLGLRAAAHSLAGQGREAYPNLKFLERELAGLA